MPLSFPGKFCSLFCSPSMYPCTGGIRKHDSTELNSFLEQKEQWPLREKETNICPYRKNSSPPVYGAHAVCQALGSGLPSLGEPWGTGRQKGNRTKLGGIGRQASSPHPGPSRRAQVLCRHPAGPNPHSPSWPRQLRSPQTKSLGSGLSSLHPLSQARAEVASSGESSWLECSSAVLFFLGYSRGCGNSHRCGEGKPPSPLPSSGERGEAQAPWSWVGPATVVPGPGGLRAEGRAPGRVGRAPRRGSGFFIKSHEA